MKIDDAENVLLRLHNTFMKVREADRPLPELLSYQRRFAAGLAVLREEKGDLHHLAVLTFQVLENLKWRIEIMKAAEAEK